MALSSLRAAITPNRFHAFVELDSETRKAFRATFSKQLHLVRFCSLLFRKQYEEKAA